MNETQGVIRAKNAKNNFGRTGWLIIFLGMFMYFCSAGVIVEGSNMLVPAFAAEHSVSEAGLYASATVASLLGIPLSIVAGVFLTKWGPRKMMALWWGLGAVGLVITGLSRSVVGYCIGRIFVTMASTGGITVSFNGLVTNWFPTKKDMIQGWATIGSNLSTAFAVIIIGLLIATVTINGTYFVCAGAFLLVAIFSLFFRDNPEDVGQLPDNDRNMTREKALELLRKGEEYQKNSPWTAKKLLKTRQVWQIAIGYGIVMLITVGILSTFVPTLMIKGLELNSAISMMTVAAVVAMPCSYLWGFLGSKLSTKKASLLLYVVVIICIAFILVPTKWSAYISVVLLGCFIGAGNNLLPSIVASVFGRYDFSRAMTVIIPIWSIVFAFATTVVGVPQSLTGSYVLSYIILLVLAVVGLILVKTLDDRCIGRMDLEDT